MPTDVNAGMVEIASRSFMSDGPPDPTRQKFVVGSFSQSAWLHVSDTRLGAVRYRDDANVRRKPKQCRGDFIVKLAVSADDPDNDKLYFIYKKWYAGMLSMIITSENDLVKDIRTWIPYWSVALLVMTAIFVCTPDRFTLAWLLVPVEMMLMRIILWVFKPPPDVYAYPPLDTNTSLESSKIDQWRRHERRYTIYNWLCVGLIITAMDHPIVIVFHLILL